MRAMDKTSFVGSGRINRQISQACSSVEAGLSYTSTVEDAVWERLVGAGLSYTYTTEDVVWESPAVQIEFTKPVVFW